MPCVGILAAAEGWHLEALRRALHRGGCDVVRCDPTRLVGRVGEKTGVEAGAFLERLDALLVRVVPPGSLDQIVFRIDALHLMADRGLPIVNSPRCLERTIDKHWTSRLLREAGVPTPRTLVSERAEEALAGFREMGDVLVKPLLGSGGRGIFRVSDEDHAWRAFRALEQQRAVIYVQEFVPHGYFDLRLFVARGNVLAAARRDGRGWKSNVAAGATTIAYRPSAEEEAAAVRAAAAVGADYSGVDLLRAEDGRLLVTEVNGIPGWAGLQETTTTDIAAAIAEIVIARAKERR
jgi:RimK family alpha-L-glutamate ligase